VLPQHELNCPQEKASKPALFRQHTAPGDMQPSPQHSAPVPHQKRSPRPLVQFFNSSMQGDAWETAYLVPWELVQHLFLGGAHVFPQHWPPLLQGKSSPSELLQQVPSLATQASPQQEEVGPQAKESPPTPLQQVPPGSMQVSPQQEEPAPQVKPMEFFSSFSWSWQ